MGIDRARTDSQAGRKALLGTFLLASMLLCGQGHAGETARITLEDLVSIPALGAPVLSPDGKQFALIRDGQIALMPADGGWPVTLTTTPGGKSAVSWSPDSKKLAFVAQGDVWVVSASGGQPKRLTDGPVGPGDPRLATDRTPRWSPTGKWILYQSGRRSYNQLFVVSEDGRTRNELASAELYYGRDRLDQGEDGVNGDEFDPSPEWSPDGSRIVYTERSREFYSGKLKIVRFDPETGRAKGEPIDLYRAKPDRGGGWVIDKMAWSPDGNTLAFVLQDSGWDKVYLLASSGGQPRQLTEGASEDSAPLFSPDGKSLAMISNRDHLEEKHIWIVPLDGSAPHRLTQLGAGVETSPQWAPDGKRIYFIRSTPLSSPDLYVASTGGDPAARALTQTLPPNFAAAGPQMPEVVHFKGKDGLDLAGILYRPRGYQAGTRYPAVIWVHGGPEGQVILKFDPWVMFLAEEGYVVFEPNYRGSSGYGENFRNLNVLDLGGGEAQDMGAAVHYLVDSGFGDPKRVAVGGGSHGGTMVNYAVTKLPDLFCAAISLYGVSNRATFLERTNRNSAIRMELKMGGTPDENPATYRQANILLDIARIRAPLLIMHGEDDPQVPLYESSQLVEALKKQGKTFWYFTYPHEGHGFQDREHRLDAWRKQLAFLNHYLQPSYGQSMTSTDAGAFLQNH